MSTYDWKTNSVAWICGGIGGTFATLLGVAQILTRQVEGKTLGEPLGMFIGLAIYFLLGAFVAWMSGEQVKLKALAIGIGLPAMVSVSGSPCSTPGVVCHGLAFNMISVGSSAYADSLLTRSFTLISPADGGDFVVWLYDRNGNPVGAPTPVQGNSTIVDLPSDASSVAVQGPEGWSATETLSGLSGQQNRLEIGNRSALARGFSQAFNMYSGPYDLDIRKMER